MPKLSAKAKIAKRKKKKIRNEPKQTKVEKVVKQMVSDEEKMIMPKLLTIPAWDFHYINFNPKINKVRDGMIFPTELSIAKLDDTSGYVRKYTFNQLSLLACGISRTYTRNRCPDDIVNLMTKWVGTIFYQDREPYGYEFKIWVCYSSNQFMPYFIQRSWSFKRVIQHILKQNQENAALYKNRKLWRCTTF